MQNLKYILLLGALGLSASCGGAGQKKVSLNNGNTSGNSKQVEALKSPGEGAVKNASPIQLTCNPGEEKPTPQRAWLLSNNQYRNTLSNLFLASQANIPHLTPPAQQTYAGTLANLMRLNRSTVRVLTDNSVTLAAHFKVNISKYVSCNVSDATCFTQFARDFGGKAFRKPLNSEQVEKLNLIYAVGKETSSERGFELAVQAMLQAPSFIYRQEIGSPSEGAGTFKLSPHEVAEQLAFLITDGPPDAKLITTANDGSLLNNSVYDEQVKRLLALPQARVVMSRFLDNLVGGSSVLKLQKSSALFPSFNEQLAQDMLTESKLFAESVAFDQNGTIAELLTSKSTFMNARLAKVYGKSDISGDSFQKVTLTDEHRAGFLTHPLVMAINSQPDHVVPTGRGRFVLNQVICRNMPTPPTIDPKLPAANPGLSPRERLEVMSNYPACASCHRLADPIGFAFERLDPIGSYRQQLKGVEIDTSGEVKGSVQTDGGFGNVTELMSMLAKSPEVRACFNLQFFRFSQGRMETPEDSCQIIEAQTTLEQSGGKLKTLIESSTRHRLRLLRTKIAD